MPTYRIAADGRSITCLRCGLTSANFNDVAHRYCAHCKVFHDDEANVAIGELFAYIQRELDYRTPGLNKPMGHIVLTREQAEQLVEWFDQLTKDEGTTRNRP